MRPIHVATAVTLAGMKLATPAAEPTLDEVYQAARDNRLDSAEEMMRQVIALHPDSAKAHYV